MSNMFLYRSMRARHEVEGDISQDQYGAQGHLFGGVPIVIIANDFPQIKSLNDLSIADDFAASRFNGRVNPEHYVAQSAILNIQDVIHLKTSKRFQDQAVPSLMAAMRASREDEPLSEAELNKLRSRKF